VFLTKASGPQPLHPVDDDEDRRRLENWGRKDAKPPCDLAHPPQKTARAVRVHVVCTFRLFALATAYRLRREHAAVGAEPVGWPRWRRQRLEQTREKVMVCAPRWYGLCPIAAFVLLVGVKLQDRPPDIGTPQVVLAKDGLTARG
jgi:hypothetical protein